MRCGTAFLVGVPVDIRRDVLRAADHGGRDVDERVDPHHHGVHCRALRRHLPPDASQDHVQPVTCRQDDDRRLDRRRMLLNTNLDPVRRHLPAGRRRTSDRGLGAVHYPSRHDAPAVLLRGVKRRLLHHSNGRHQRSVHAHSLLHTPLGTQPRQRRRPSRR